MLFQRQPGSLELHPHPRVHRASRPRHGNAPGQAVDRHGRALADVGTSGGQGVELVEQVVDAEIDPRLLEAVAGAQVEQTVAAGRDFIAHGGNLRLGLDQHPFQRVVPSAQLLRETEPGVERHDGVEVVSRAGVFPAGVVHHALQPQPAERAVAQRHLAREIQPVQPRGLVDIFEDDELVFQRRGLRRVGHCVPLHRVDVIADMGVERLRGERPSAVGAVQIEAGRQGGGFFWLEIGVADVAVAVADEVVHHRGHRPGAPGIALVEAGRAGGVAQAHREILRGSKRPARQQRGIDMGVGARAVDGVERRGVAQLVVHHRAHAIAVGIAVHRPGIGAHALHPQPRQGLPFRAELLLPFAPHADAVALAVVDVEEGAGPHHPARRRPVVVEVIALQLDSGAQHVLRRQIDACLQLHPGGAALAIHRHAGGAGGRQRAAGIAAHAALHGLAAVPEAFVCAEVHEVIDGFMVGARIERAPAELLEPVQIDAFFGIAQHVHALVGVELIRHVLIAQTDFKQLIAALPRQPQGVVAHVVGGGADEVAREALPRAAGGGKGFEVAPGGVVIGLGQCAVVGDGEPRRAVISVQPEAARIAVAGIARADLAAGDRRLPRRGELRRAGFHLDGAADGIATDRHRHHARRIHGDALHLRRRGVRQHRVHVVGAAGDQPHAVELDVEVVVRQAVVLRQPGDAARRVDRQAGNAQQQAGGVIRCGAALGQIDGALPLRPGLRASGRARDDDFGQGGLGGLDVAGAQRRQCGTQGD